MPDSFCGAIPDDRLYDPKFDMWVRHDADGYVTLGATAFGLFLAGEIIMFTGKPRGAEVARGRGIGTVETGKTVLAVHAPISVVNLQCNDAAEDQPRIINKFPYDEGWLAKAHAASWLSELSLLVDAAAYRQHILSINPTARFVTNS